MAVTERTLRLVQDLRAQLDMVVDEQSRDLVRMWATAFDEVAPDLNTALVDLLTTPGERITRAQMLRSQRLMGALEIIAERLEVLAGEAGVRITGDLAGVIETAGAAQASVIDSQLPPGSRLVDPAGWARVDAAQIEAIVERSTQRIVSTLQPLPDDVMDVVRRELIRSVAAGSNPRVTARRMVGRVEGHVNGRWGLTRALAIARTETVDAHREAARVSQLENADVLTGWEWACKLDARSCPACWAMHGTRFDLTEPGPLGHPQCRCARLPRTASWEELGFDIEEPEDLMPDAAAQFELLSEADQRAVLGPLRFDAWQAGEYPIEAWAQRRENPGWRASYQMSPAPRGGRRSVTAA
jgi:SPP1 gp7 family putative phage head morphogenesis protein